jgi:hypothetical protein
MNFPQCLNPGDTLTLQWEGQEIRFTMGERLVVRSIEHALEIYKSWPEVVYTEIRGGGLLSSPTGMVRLVGKVRPQNLHKYADKVKHDRMD